MKLIKLSFYMKVVLDSCEILIPRNDMHVGIKVISYEYILCPLLNLQTFETIIYIPTLKKNIRFTFLSSKKNETLFKILYSYTRLKHNTRF